MHSYFCPYNIGRFMSPKRVLEICFNEPQEKHDQGLLETVCFIFNDRANASAVKLN